MPPRMTTGAAAFLLASALLAPIAAQAQILVGNSVFPRAGDTLHYALDTSPTGPASQVTPPGFGQQPWDFSKLKATTTWTETLRPAATGAGAQYFTDATLVYTQTGPASVNFPLVPGSIGTDAYLQVTDSAVKLLGFYGGNDALYSGVGAYVVGNPNGPVPLGAATDFLTRYTQYVVGTAVSVGGTPIQLRWAPTNFFDIRQMSANTLETYPVSAIPGPLPFSADQFRLRVGLSAITIVDGYGTLVLPGGGNFEVLREKTTTYVETLVDAHIPPLGWLDVTDITAQYGALPDVHLGVWQQTTYRYFDAESKESLATVYMTARDPSQPSNTFTESVEQVQFKNLAPVPEPQTAVMFLAGLTALWGWARKTRTRA